MDIVELTENIRDGMLTELAEYAAARERCDLDDLEDSQVIEAGVKEGMYLAEGILSESVIRRLAELDLPNALERHQDRMDAAAEEDPDLQEPVGSCSDCPERDDCRERDPDTNEPKAFV